MARNDKTLFNQLTNQKTYIQIYNELESLGCNVLNSTLQPYQDKTYFNYKMFYRGSLAAFYDYELEELLMLPWDNIGRLDVYDRPREIMARSKYYRKVLKEGEFVILWDNLQHKPLMPKIVQCALRLTLIRRVIDVNIKQQKTPRIIQCPENQKLTFANMLNDIDSCDDVINGYKNLNVDGLETILMPAPYVADKLETEYEKIYSEALRYLGIASVSYEKRERLIRDEVTMSQGGTIANRYNRFNSYKEGFERINDMFGQYLERKFEVEFYDGLPTTLTNTTDTETDETDTEEVLENE